MNAQKPIRKVGTHDGRFHTDEVMATAILKEIFQIEVTRTRDSEILNTLDIVYDVGGGEFDHHGPEKVYRDNGIPMAACGLIWRKFGTEVVRFYDSNLTEEELGSVSRYVDRVLIEGIDALDNGMRLQNKDLSVMNITAIISGYNPLWYSVEPET